MIDLQAIYECEISFCTSFSSRTQTAYGVLFCNEENKDSHDSNHAYYLNYDYPVEEAISDIIRFYRSKAITPRLYTAFRKEEAVVLLPLLEARGFEIYKDTIYFSQHCTDPVAQEKDPAISVRRLPEITEDVADIIHSVDDGDWNLNLLRRQIHDPTLHVLGAFRKGHCRAIATIQLMDGFTRVDHVTTHREYREQRLGTQLIHHLVRYHRDISDNTLYLYASNPIAIHMYQQAGFKEFSVETPVWTAWLS